MTITYNFQMVSFLLLYQSTSVAPQLPFCALREVRINAPAEFEKFRLVTLVPACTQLFFSQTRPQPRP